MFPCQCMQCACAKLKVLHNNILCLCNSQGWLWRVGQRGHGLPNFSHTPTDCYLLLEVVSLSLHPLHASARSWAWSDFVWKSGHAQLAQEYSLGLYQPLTAHVTFYSCCQQKLQTDLLRFFTHQLGFLFQSEGLVTEKGLVKLSGLWITPLYTMMLSEMSFYATPVW